MHHQVIISYISFVLSYISIVSTSPQIAKHVTILNKSGSKLQVYWLTPSGKQVPFADVYNGARKEIDSFVNHTFVVRQADVESQQSRIGYLTVGETENEVILIKKNMVMEREDENYQEFNQTTDNGRMTFIHSCMEKVSTNGNVLDSSTDELLACVEERLTINLVEKNREISFEGKIREHIGSILENYTCLDSGLPTTQGKEIRSWEYRDTTYNVSVLHQRPDSQIHLIKNFITHDECEAFQGAAAQHLHRGTVADGNGGSRLSENRKAWQAGITVPWEKEAEGDDLVGYTRRMYAYTNDATKYNIDVVGQEDIMSIQYFGENGDHPSGSYYTPQTPDRYMPHCDGDCHGLPHRKGARVATMVAYCTVPTKGGATNFPNVGAHVNPEIGTAVFFSYMNPATTLMDTGWTTHSGCPVTEGTKRIVVHWMRVGVSADEPWDSFNTLNLPKRFVKDYD